MERDFSRLEEAKGELLESARQAWSAFEKDRQVMADVGKEFNLAFGTFRSSLAEATFHQAMTAAWERYVVATRAT